MGDWKGYETQRVQPRNEQVHQRAVDAKPKPDKKYVSESSEKPLLTAIDQGGRAELGGLIYDMPSSPVLKTIRNTEIKIMAALHAKDAAPTSSADTKRDASGFMQKFGLEHRKGHIAGLARALNSDQGENLVRAVMANWSEEDGHTGKEIAYQGAALLEAAGDNDSLRTRVREQLTANQNWQGMIKGDASKGLEIPGLRPEDQSVLPGAVNFELPAAPQTRIDSMLNPLLDKWRTKVSEKTTYDRAMQMAREFQEPTDEASQTGDQLLQAVNSL